MGGLERWEEGLKPRAGIAVVAALMAWASATCLAAPAAAPVEGRDMGKFEQWKQQVKTGGRERVYRGERLRSVAMPLGGIGAGVIALAGDGSLRQWQIFNMPNHQAAIPDSFFAIWAKSGESKPVAKVLQSSALYNGKFDPAPCVSDHIVPEEAKRLLSELPGVAATEYIGEYPIAEVSYKDKELPVEVSLEAFSPFIPLNSKDSGLPAIIFVFKVHNPGKEEVQVSLAATLQNAVGYDGIGHVSGVSFPGYGGNRNEVVESGGCTAVWMEGTFLPTKDAANGTMVLAVLSKNATYLASWDDLKSFWADFSQDGALANVKASEPSAKGKTHNAALAAPIELGPGEEKTVTFIYAWHFPNHYVNWGQGGFGIPDEKSLFWMGNAYGAWFGDAGQVLDYVVHNFEKLAGETRLFRKTFYDSTLPYWLLDCVSSQISTIRSTTCLWNEDGTFHGFEGCCGASTGSPEGTGGCCPLNCTHVWNYEMALSRLFPDLERTMRDTDIVAQLLESGEIPHRTVLPKYLPRWKDAAAADGQCGTILKTYREYLQSGDLEFLRKLWPGIKRAMGYAITRWDEDGDGVMDGAQWNTYDCNVYGHNSYITGFFLASLRAAEEMAKVMGEPELAKSYRERYDKGRAKLDSETFDGEYYVQIYDEKRYPETQYGKGCLSDQLIGQWWAGIVGLGHILPPEHVRSALASIYKCNFRHDFAGFTQAPRIFASPGDMGLLNCTWPKGGRPEKEAILYSDEVWTGVEYEVAGLMISEGMVDEGLQIAKAARDRYDGTKRNPWNEVECGDHYARPMSSWWLIEAVAGYHYDAPQGAISFAPRLPMPFRSFFITSHGWGTFSETGDGHAQSEELALAWGELTLRSFTFAWRAERRKPSHVEATADGKPVDSTWTYDQGQVRIEFSSALTLGAGGKLVVRAE
jgi:uncharacterized protein (DUF608 family)